MPVHYTKNLASETISFDTIDMDNTIQLTNHILVAMPRLDDPNFSHTLTLICDHDDHGALGIVVNRPAKITLKKLLDYLDIPNHSAHFSQTPIFLGGPVHKDRGFVLHRPLGAWDSSITIAGDLALTSSRDILEAIVQGEAGPTDALVILGYAGWGAGQLEQELADNIWLTLPAEESILFETPPESRWHAAAARLGIDLDLISPDAGHA